MLSRSLRQLFEVIDRPGAARLALLMLLAAMTEGIGLLLLVPMLTALGGTGASVGITQWISQAGIPVKLGPLLAIFAGLVLLRAIVNFARDLESQGFIAALVDGLRAKAWDALLHCDWRTLSAMRQTDNASLLIDNVDRVGTGVHYLVSLATMATTLAGIALAALAISPAVALAAAVGGLLVLIAHRGLARRASEIGKDLGEAYRTVYGRLAEGLGALRVIKSFGKEAEAASGVGEGFAALRRAERQFVRDAGWARLALEAGGAAVLALTVWFAISRWGQGPAEILPLVALFARAVPLLSALQGTWQNWSHARPAVDEVLTLIDVLEAAREPGDDTAAAPRLAREIAFQGVAVEFTGRAWAALDDVTVTIPARGITAIAGPSGAGKSTFTDLAGGLIGPDRGHVTIDGQELTPAHRRAWRSRVAYVQQEPVLFSGTIRENLRWADPGASEGQLKAALAEASARFVEALPEGLDTKVGEGGRQLSGGERQRIVLARALLREPDLLVLDEATSALDAENETAIAEALCCLRTKMAIIVVCHRGVLQELADRTILLENGRIIRVENRTELVS